MSRSLVAGMRETLVRILIVDDQDFIRRGIRALLSELKEVEVCGEALDGPEAITKVRELQPDVVIMDISMPKMDGIQATREICRAHPSVRVITLSQYEIPDVLKVAMSVGAVTHVPKTAVWTRLIPALRSLSINPEPTFERTGAIRVLIADDHEAVRKGIRAILASANIDVCGEAANGSEAVTRAMELKPDLVILDLTMPVMGGFEAATALSRTLPKVPLLFYSIHEGAQLIKEAKRIGVRGFVNKNRISDTLLDAVSVLVIQRGTFFPDLTQTSALLG
jgi:DNA-binding NarL/FixJ family response regulator